MRQQNRDRETKLNRVRSTDILLCCCESVCLSAGALEGLCGVELGAGVGLSGLVAARYMRHMILTDRVAVLQELMQQNVALNSLQDRASVADLDWGIEGARKLMQQHSPTAAVAESSTSSAAAAAASSAPASAAPAAAPFVWDPSSALIIAADVVYPDTSDEALIALFQTVETLLQRPDDASTAAASSASTAVPSSDASSASSNSLPFPLRGSFICAYLSRDSATSRRLLEAAANAGFEARPVDQSMLSRKSVAGVESASAAAAASAATPDAGVHPSAVIQFRKVVSVVRRPDSGLAEFMYLPSLHHLWSPPLSRAQQALEELEELTEDNALAGLGSMSSSEDEEEEERRREREAAEDEERYGGL